MVSLRASEDCAADVAICTPDGCPLSSSLSVTVARPVGVGVDAR